MLVRHLARQLLVQRLLRHEQATLQEVQSIAAAARQDVEAALQAALDRLPGYEYAAHEQQQEQPQQVAGEAAGQELPADPVATAEQLLACRAELQQLAAQVHAETLPAHRAVFGCLHQLLYPPHGGNGEAGSGASGSGGETAAAAAAELELTPAALQAQLAKAAAAKQALSLAATGVMSEALARQQAPGERLAETVLLHFWGEPERLVALAEKQNRQLASYGAAV